MARLQGSKVCLKRAAAKGRCMDELSSWSSGLCHLVMPMDGIISLLRGIKRSGANKLGKGFDMTIDKQVVAWTVRPFRGRSIASVVRRDTCVLTLVWVG